MNIDDILPRARLLPPPPVPTTEPESFESLIKRTCAYNQLNVGAVISYLLKSHFGVPAPQSQKMNEPFHLLSLGGDVSQRWRSAFETLIGADQLKGHTWAEVFCPGPLPAARTTLQWCSDCYEEDLRKPHGPYDRLLWTAKEVVVCPVHRRELVDVCSHCDGRGIRPLNARHCIGFCPACDVWLGNITPRIGSQVVGPHTSWVAQALATALAQTAGRGPFKVQFPDQNLVEALLDKHFQGQGTTMARAIARSKSTLWSWILMGVRSLEAMLELAYLMDMEFVDLLRDSAAAVKRSKFRHERVSELRRNNYEVRRTPRPLNWVEVDQYLQAVEDGAYPEIRTIGHVCEALDIDRKLLIRHHAVRARLLSATLRQRRKDIQHDAHAKRVVELKDAVDRVRKACGLPLLRRREFFDEVNKIVGQSIQRHEAKLVWTMATQPVRDFSLLLQPQCCLVLPPSKKKPSGD